MASLGFVGEARRVSAAISPGTVVKTKAGDFVALWDPNWSIVADSMIEVDRFSFAVVRKNKSRPLSGLLHQAVFVM
jgi:hypothetical protein